MKNRLLQFSLVLFSFGLAVILLSATFKDKGKTPPQNSDQYLTLLRANQHTGAINMADVLRSRIQAEKNSSLNSSREFDFEWETRGPNNIGGRTRAIIFDKKDPSGNTIIAGSVMGGMFKSTNGGNSWVKTNPEGTCMHVTCIAQAPNGDIYVGTGEGFTIDEYIVLGEWGYTGGFQGEGMFKSSDGENFSIIPSTSPNGSEWNMINELVIHSDGRIYASTNTGLKYSDDGGFTWYTAKTGTGEDLMGISKEVKVANDGTIITEVGNLCYLATDGNPQNFSLISGDSSIYIPTNIGRAEFAFSSDPNIVYALVVNSGGALVNVYRSNDKGLNWYIIGPGGSSNFNVFNTGTNIAAGIGLYACAIQVFPDNPDHILIGGLNMWDGMKATEEGYYDWTERSSNVFFLSTNYLPLNQHTFVFNPVTSSQCFVGNNGGIYRGILGSEFEFQSANKDYIAAQMYSVSYTYADNIIAGGSQDLGTLVIDGSLNPSDAKRGIDIWTTPAGLPDGATGGNVAYSMIYPRSVVYSRYPHPARSGNIENFVRRNEYGGFTDWAASLFNDRYRSDAFISPFLFWESFWDMYSGDSTDYYAIQDIPAGTTFYVESNNANRPFKYTTPVDITKFDSVRVPDPISSKFFIGGTDRVLMTTELIRYELSPEWFVISDVDHGGVEGIPQSMAYSVDANFLFVGTLDGKLYRISNIKYAYDFDRADVTSPYCIISTQKIPVYLPGTTTEISQVITSVAVNPNNANHVVITCGNYGNEHYAYLSTNALSDNPEFKSIQGNPNGDGLPQMPVYSSLFEMDANNNLLMLGTEIGIYVSTNWNTSNPSWTAQNKNIGKVPVFQIKQQLLSKPEDALMFISETDTSYTIIPGNDNFGMIYAATYGRGIISLNDFYKPVGINENPITTSQDFDINVYPNPASDQFRVEFMLKEKSNSTIEIYNFNGMQVRKQQMGLMNAGLHKATFDGSGLMKGAYLVRVTAGSSSATSKVIIY